MLCRFAKHFPENFTFSEDGKSFIEPEVFEINVWNQVPRPAMCNLVRNDVG